MVKLAVIRQYADGDTVISEFIMEGTHRTGSDSCSADKSIPTYVYDDSLVLGNMMLAAHSLGLGSC